MKRRGHCLPCTCCLLKDGWEDLENKDGDMLMLLTVVVQRAAYTGVVWKLVKVTEMWSSSISREWTLLVVNIFYVAYLRL